MGFFRRSFGELWSGYGDLLCKSGELLGKLWSGYGDDRAERASMERVRRVPQNFSPSAEAELRQLPKASHSQKLVQVQIFC